MTDAKDYGIEGKFPLIAEFEAISDKSGLQTAYDTYCRWLEGNYIAEMLPRQKIDATDVNNIIEKSANQSLLDQMNQAENADDIGTDILQHLAKDFAENLDIDDFTNRINYQRYERVVRQLLVSLVTKANEAYKAGAISADDREKLIYAAEEKTERHLGDKYASFAEPEDTEL
jgi:hypothetical protein